MKKSAWLTVAMKFQRGLIPEKRLGVAGRADGYVKAYAQLYDEIVRGYEDGTREIYVAGGDGPASLRRKMSRMPWMRHTGKQWTALWRWSGRTSTPASSLARKRKRLQRSAEGKQRRQIS